MTTTDKMIQVNQLVDREVLSMRNKLFPFAQMRTKHSYSLFIENRNTYICLSWMFAVLYWKNKSLQKFVHLNTNLCAFVDIR